MDARLADSTAGDAMVTADSSTADAPSVPRPDAMGAACATGGNYAFTVRPFASQKGTFTAFFTVTPSRAPTNSVIGLSDGQKYLHDDYAAIVRFGTSGNLDVRNGTAYSSLVPIKYTVTDYHFRLVVDVPGRSTPPTSPTAACPRSRWAPTSPSATAPPCRPSSATGAWKRSLAA